MNTVTELLQPVENDLDDLILELKNLIGAGHPILQAAAEHLFSAGGKRLRPGIVLLISKAISPEFCLTTKHKRLAEITEMIHTASLVHDDVVDEASTRRGVDTVHSRFNTRVAVLAGDFLFAQASWHLANLDNVNVVKLLSRVIMDLAEGEIKQNLNRFDSAFQVVDDILDFTGNDKQLGKPAVSDLASGYLTAPVLYALEENKQLSVLINRELAEKDDLDDALNIIMNSKAIESSRKLAEDFAMLSKEAIVWLPDSEYKRALMALPEFVLSRIY